ncbi:MAG: hypothetical protein PWQ80_1373 [Thermotoga sp.]|nr:hypothetical protein [Thermotoga sp.]MDK2950145.1 hypothetical protein [Thermotoga sp.]
MKKGLSSGKGSGINTPRHFRTFFKRSPSPRRAVCSPARQFADPSQLLIGGRPCPSVFAEFFRYLVREGKTYGTASEYVREVKKYLRGIRKDTDRFKAAVNRWKKPCRERGKIMW